MNMEDGQDHICVDGWYGHDYNLTGSYSANYDSGYQHCNQISVSSVTGWNENGNPNYIIGGVTLQIK